MTKSLRKNPEERKEEMEKRRPHRVRPGEVNRNLLKTCQGSSGPMRPCLNKKKRLRGPAKLSP
ncbi:MAG: hypothetical protein KKG10_03170 [Proteobacteria bacterium]|nr:hypothetical protein [Pseudomonadota bacterium]